MRPFQSSGGRLAQAQIAHFALFHQVGHGADRFFDGHVGVDTVLVVQVQRIHPQALQGAVDGVADIVGPAIHPAHYGVGRVAHNPEFTGQEHLVALAGNSLADQLLIGVRAVHVSGI